MKAIIIKVWALICLLFMLTCGTIPWLMSNNIIPIGIIIPLMGLTSGILAYIFYCIGRDIFKETMKIIDNPDK